MRKSIIILSVLAFLAMGSCEMPDGNDPETPGPVPINPVGEWLLDGNADDSSGNDNHGSIENSPVTTLGINNAVDSAFSFTNSSAQYIHAPFADPGDSYTMTISVWVRSDFSFNGIGSPISINNGTDTSGDFAFWFFVDGNFYLSSGGTSINAISGYSSAFTNNFLFPVRNLPLKSALHTSLGTSGSKMG
jgi:hypothetical protein